MSESNLSFKWLNKEFIKDITIAKYSINPDCFEIRNFETTYASSKGDNYFGTVFRLKVIIFLTKTKEIVEDHYIVKTKAGESDSESECNVMTEELQAYQIEIETYEKVIPELEKIWKNVGENVNLGPRCYKIYRHPTDIIVLEDLKHTGFHVADRHSVLKMDEVDLVLQWLAKFHAASVIYVQKNGPLSKTFSRGMFSKEHIGKSWGTHYNQLYKTFKMLKWDNKISAKLDTFEDSIYEKCCEAMEVDNKDLNVLNHGDIWILNILFAERDSIKDISVIDFQFASWGSPVQDLWFLISTSTNIDDRIKNLKKIIHDYHKYLVFNLKKLNFNGNIPTEEEFYTNFIKRGIIALGITIESFAAISIDKGLQIDFEIVARDDPDAIEIRKKIFMNDRFINTTNKYLKFLDELGIFD